MNVTYACPHCEATTRSELGSEELNLTCTACGQQIAAPPDAVTDGKLHRCAVCPGTELFLRKDFPQRLGVGIVIVGFALSCYFWAQYDQFWTFAVLFGVVLIDVALYLLIGNCVMCYRCHSQYRDVPNMDNFGAFELATHERYRQQEARLSGRG